MAYTRTRSQLAALAVKQRVARCPFRKTMASGCRIGKPRNKARAEGVEGPDCANGTYHAGNFKRNGAVTTNTKMKSKATSEMKTKTKAAKVDPFFKAHIGRIASAMGCADLKFNNDVLSALQKIPEATLKGVVEQLSLVVQHAGRKVVKEEDVAFLKVMSSSMW